MAIGNLIIDNRPHGLPHAANYYEIFREEPSPLGPLLFGARFTTLMGEDASIDLLLDIMLKLPPEAVVVLVCHAVKGGLLLRVARRASQGDAIFDNLQIINLTIEKEAEAGRIRQLPTSTDAEKNIRLSKWSQLCNDMQAGVLTGNFTEAQAQETYEKLIEVRAKAFQFPADAKKSRNPAFRAFLTKLLAVRKQNRARMELRACNIGSDQRGLDGVRRFFNVQKLVAPDSETFFMSNMPVRVAGRPAAKKGGSGVKAGARPGPLGAAPTPADIAGIKQTFKNPERKTRGFVKLTIPGASTGADPVFAVTVSLKEKDFVFAGEVTVVSTGDLVTPDWLKVKEFLKTSIHPLPVWSSGPFPLAGLWTFPDTPNMPFLFARDADYIKHLIQSPPASR